MKVARWQAWLGLLGRLILGGVLLLAGWLKAFNHSEAQMAVRAYQILPTSFANLLGLTLPWLEIGVAILLILGVATKPAAVLGGLLMIFFIVAIAQAGLRGLSIDCGCFGGGGTVAKGHTKYLEEIARDTGLFLIAVYLYRYPSTKFSIDRQGNSDGNS